MIGRVEPAPGGARRRRAVAAWCLLAVGLPVMTVALVALRGSVSLESALLLYLLAVVIIAIVGGAVPGLVTVVAADVLANYFLVPPYRTLHINSSDHLLAIVVFLVVGGLVSVLVELGSRRREEIARARAETQVWARIAAEPVGAMSADSVLEELRRTFDLSVARLFVDNHDEPARLVAQVGEDAPDDDSIVVSLGGGMSLRAGGPERLARDRQGLQDLALSAARAYEGRELAKDAERAEALTEVDRVRSALLAAVGHDLRTPLAGVKAAVSSLRQQDVDWTPDERAELLTTIEESADRLDGLVANLLDMTRIQAGAVVVDFVDVSVEEIVAGSLVNVPADEVLVDVAESLPLIRTDPGLLERVIANLVENARRYRPEGTLVEVRGTPAAQSVTISVTDHGPGIDPADRASVFEPFQRLGDRSQGGTGLGLAIARGFVQALHGTIEPTQTPGGGLTMRVTLPVAP